MNPACDTATLWIFASCFGLSILSALLPWFNGELIVLSFAALLGSPLDLAILAVLAAAGQMLGKCALYWVGTRAATLDVARTARVDRWRGRLCGRPLRALALVFVSSAAGIPPLYVTTIAAGTLGMAFPRFLGAAACGRVLRFAGVVFCPRFVVGLLHGA
jgi:membrane protein YqaA with SNARE-associated domain